MADFHPQLPVSLHPSLDPMLPHGSQKTAGNHASREEEQQRVTIATNTTTTRKKKKRTCRAGVTEQLSSLVERPVISIELSRLVGYPPSSQDEVDSIQSQLIEAMWTRYRTDYGNDYNCDDDDDHHHHPTTMANEEDPVTTQPAIQQEFKESTAPSMEEAITFPPPVVPPDFDNQITELLEARMARFGPPPQLQPVIGSIDPEHGKYIKDNNRRFNYLTLSYPPKIRISPNTTWNDVWLDTAQAWNDIQNLANILPLASQKSEGNAVDNDSNNGAAAAGTTTLCFIEKLTQHLLSTSRSLSWKHAMACELRQCLKQELWEKQHHEWISTERKVKLENLYAVRETLVYQTELAKLHFHQLCQQRESCVSQELSFQIHQSQNQQGQGTARGGSEILLDNSSIFETMDVVDLAQEFQLFGMFPRNQLEPLQLQDKDNDDDDDDDDYLGSLSMSGGFDDSDDNASNVSSSLNSSNGSCHDSHSLEYDADEDCCEIDATVDENAFPVVAGIDSCNVGNVTAVRSPVQLGDSVVDQSAQIENSPQLEPVLSLPFQRRKERRQKVKQQRQEERLKMEREIKREALKAAQEELRIKHTTKEMILAQTKLQAFQKKVLDVDELLESLQDEVWAAEEEEQEKEGPTTENAAKETSSVEGRNQISKLSLLDQVLAMVLGALPVDPGQSTQTHYQLIKQEHQAIVSGWKAYFGRLPPPALSENSINFNITRSTKADDMVEKAK
jgi:hypothetical protein